MTSMPARRDYRTGPSLPGGLSQRVCRRCRLFFDCLTFQCTFCDGPLELTKIYNVPPKPRR